MEGSQGESAAAPKALPEALLRLCPRLCSGARAESARCPFRHGHEGHANVVTEELGLPSARALSGNDALRAHGPNAVSAWCRATGTVPELCGSRAGKEPPYFARRRLLRPRRLLRRPHRGRRPNPSSAQPRSPTADVADKHGIWITWLSMSRSSRTEPRPGPRLRSSLSAGLRSAADGSSLIRWRAPWLRWRRPRCRRIR